MKKTCWMVKSEPESYSWEQFLRDGTTDWTGVRNYAARLNLKAMAVGDKVLFYESVGPKSVVGTATVSKTFFPDKTADEDGWVAVQLKAGKAFKKPVTLAEIKAEPSLAKMELIRLSRLSVAKVTPEEFAKILAMGGLA